jgi:tetratricopeptide (TPR) repeat protein
MNGQTVLAERLILAANGDPRGDAISVKKLLPSLWLYGPVPVAEAARRCECLLEGRPALRVEASAVRCLALLRAMVGRFDEARTLADRDREILDELVHPTIRAAIKQIPAAIEFLAGNLDEAERLLRSGLADLDALGTALRAGQLASMLARVLYERGDYTQAWTASEQAEGGETFDIEVGVHWRGVRAKLLARHGSFEQAVAVARESILLVERTDSLNVHGDALADLGEVLLLAGRPQEARAALEAALRLYDQKGNLISARRVREALVEIGRAVALKAVSAGAAPSS